MEQWNAKEVIISIGNQQITGKKCHLQDLTVNYPVNEVEEVRFLKGDRIIRDLNPQPMKVTMTFLCEPEHFIQEFWDEDYKPKISYKKVEDCTVQELLFAVREKVRRKK